MSYIYKITNKINQKLYIGKTEFSIEKRFKEHCSDAFRERNEKRPLYAAMRKYGIENFEISLVEETDNPEEREIYWINYYDTYSNGYNATKGGDGKCHYDHNDILCRLLKHPYPKDIAEEVGCCVDIVSLIAKNNNIEVKNKSQEKLKETAKLIGAYNIKTLELIQIFNSTVEAAEWCFHNKKCTTLNSGVRGHISEVANGKRKSAYGYFWKYI